MAISVKWRRYLVLSYSIMLAGTGIGLLVAGSWFLYLHMEFGSVLGGTPWSPMVGLICCGGLSIALSFLGWRGANKKHAWLVIVFTVLLIGLIAGLFGICGVALVKRQTLPQESVGIVEQSFRNTMLGSPTHATLWESIQNELGCCGLDGPTDYRRLQLGIPWACCTTSGGSTAGSCGAVHQRGCLDVIVDGERTLLSRLALVALGAALLQSIGLFCSVHLALALRRKTPQRLRPLNYRPPVPPMSYRYQHNKSLLRATSMPDKV